MTILKTQTILNSNQTIELKEKTGFEFGFGLKESYTHAVHRRSNLKKVFFVWIYISNSNQKIQNIQNPNKSKPNIRKSAARGSSKAETHRRWGDFRLFYLLHLGSLEGWLMSNYTKVLILDSCRLSKSRTKPASTTDTGSISLHGYWGSQKKPELLWSNIMSHTTTTYTQQLQASMGLRRDANTKYYTILVS